MLASPGVSLDHVKVVATTTPLGSRRVANSWSWNPTGSGGSLARRPLKLIVLGGGGGGSPLQAPKDSADAGYQLPSLCF